jgi:hypothetical protein
MASDELANRRKDPRIDVFVQAEVRLRDVRIMEVRNVSAGGIYLVGTQQEYPELTPGTALDLVIFGAEDGVGDDPDFNIACRASITRIDQGNPGKRPPGFGATIDPIDDDARERLANLLMRADSYRVGDPRR